MQSERLDYNVLLKRLMEIRAGSLGIVMTNSEFVYLMQLGIQEATRHA